MSNIVDNDLQTIIHGVGLSELNKLQGKTVLISGCSGFLGSWFVAIFQSLNQHYFDKPVSVVGLDSFIATEKSNHIVEITNKDIHLIQADISTYRQGYKVDFIIHAAGIASPVYYRKFPIETIDGMALGLSNLLKFASEMTVESFLNFSSSEAYGNPSNDAVPTKESYNGNVSSTGPRSCYDESKRFGETLCVAYHKVHNIPVKTVRPFNVYGAGMRPADDRVVPKFLYAALKGEEITVHSPSTQTRTFCYITDAMIGFMKVLLLGRNGDIYNIGNDSPEISVNELANIINAKFDNKIRITEIEMPEEYPTDQAQRRCPDLTKAKTDLNYDPTTTLDIGIEKMRQWCIDILKSKRYE